jgi:dipeptidyl aminopeptidase/acylaminoacyl peptidase
MLARLLGLATLTAAVSCGPSTPKPKYWMPDPVVVPVRPADPVPDPGAVVEPPPVDPGYTGLGAESVSPEVIAQFAAPPLDPSVTEHIQSMLDVRGVGGGLLTAKADRMFFTWRVTGTSQVWRMDGPMKYPVQLTGGEDNTSVVALAPDDSFVLVSRDKGGAENPGLFLLDVDGGALTEIHRVDKVQTFAAFISDDSKGVYFLSNDRDPGAYALYRWDVESHETTPVFTEPGLWSVADQRGDRVLLANALGNTHIEISELDLATGKLTPIIGQGEAEEYSARYGAKKDTLLIETNKIGDFSRVYEWKAGKLTAITPDIKYDVSGFGIDQARTRIYYTTNEDGYTRSHALDARTYKPLTLPKVPAADNVAFAGATRNGRYVQIVYDGGRQAPTTIVWDWKTKKKATWRVPSTPEIDVTTFARASLESYPARDGTPIPMFVWRPDASRCTGPCPVVVEFHGGPEGQSAAGFSAYAQMFVDAGFVFVRPNVRGSTGYGKTWLHADDAAKRLDVVTDIEDASVFIRKSWAVDGVAPKVGVAGGSYGGYSALMAMSFFAGAYDAGVAEVGISNLVTFLENTAPYRRILRTSEYGDPATDREALVKLSPITYVDKVAAPLLVIQGVNDPRVPVNEALQIYRKLEERGVPGKLILFADEGHGTSKRSNQVLAIGHRIAFFQEHLK